MHDQENPGASSAHPAHDADRSIAEPSESSPELQHDDSAQEAPPAPRERMSAEEADNYPMPTYEQVAKSMARALRFPSSCPHQEEVARQVAEGRKMARAEKDGRGSRDDTTARNAPGREARPQVHPNGQAPGSNPGAKKRRSRNRNRSGGANRAPAGAHQTA